MSNWLIAFLSTLFIGGVVSIVTKDYQYFDASTFLAFCIGVIWVLGKVFT